MRPNLAKTDREAGSATVEAVVLVPVLVIFVVLSVAFGRYQTTREEVIGAARQPRKRRRSCHRPSRRAQQRRPLPCLRYPDRIHHVSESLYQLIRQISCPAVR